MARRSAAAKIDPGLGADELIIDNFCGGGGASAGIERALARFAPGRHVDAAINHDAPAIAMHQANHPNTHHYCQSIWKVDPRQVVIDVSRRRGSVVPLRVGLAWFSPDCTDHSKAKGGAPIRDRQSRDLAWVIIRWAKLPKSYRPRVIMMENVEEWLEWSPLRQRVWPAGTEKAGQPMFDLKGRPVYERDPDRKGETFYKWLKKLEAQGYQVEWREIRGCDHGAPTIRKRLFLQARCDGVPITWPAETHGPIGNAKGLNPYRTAADCIDWSIPCPSIFTPGRDLVEATLKRIARGVMRYVVNAKKPFIVPITRRGDARVHPIDEPLRTVTTGKRGEFAVIAPTLVSVAHSKSTGRGPAAWSAEQPLRTITSSSGHAVVAAHLTKFAENSTGSEADQPLHTVMAGAPRHGLVAATLVPRYGERPGQAPRCQDIEEPISTIVPTGNGAQLVTAFLAQHNGGPKNNKRPLSRSVEKPLSTATTRGTQQGLVVACLSHQYTSNTAGGEGDPEKPIKTVLTGNHASLVCAFLQKYFSTGGQDFPADGPMHTIRTRGAMSVVTVEIDGETYEIVDIGMRMLTPRELFRAQGFNDNYVIDVQLTGELIEMDFKARKRVGKGRRRSLWLTKEEQTRCCGNSVNPDVADALVMNAFAPAWRERRAA